MTMTPSCHARIDKTNFGTRDLEIVNASENDGAYQEDLWAR